MSSIGRFYYCTVFYIIFLSRILNRLTAKDNDAESGKSPLPPPGPFVTPLLNQQLSGIQPKFMVLSKSSSNKDNNGLISLYSTYPDILFPDSTEKKLVKTEDDSTTKNGRDIKNVADETTTTTPTKKEPGGGVGSSNDSSSSPLQQA